MSFKVKKGLTKTTMWRKIRIDGIDVEFPTDLLDEMTEELEKARRRKATSKEKKETDQDQIWKDLADFATKLSLRMSGIDTDSEEGTTSLRKEVKGADVSPKPNKRDIDLYLSLIGQLKRLKSLSDKIRQIKDEYFVNTRDVPYEELRGRKEFRENVSEVLSTAREFLREVPSARKLARALGETVLGDKDLTDHYLEYAELFTENAETYIQSIENYDELHEKISFQVADLVSYLSSTIEEVFDNIRMIALVTWEEVFKKHSDEFSPLPSPYLQELHKEVRGMRGIELIKARKDLEEKRKALKEREEKYGYKAGRNAHLSKPKEYADVPESQFADPVGYNYPVNTPKRARAALAYFVRFHDQYDDPNAKIFIYERILRALKKFGIKRHFNPDFPLDWLVSDDLKEWMEGYDEYRDQDTEEMKEKMLRRLKREQRRLLKQISPTSYMVIPSLGSVMVDEDKLPQLQRELGQNIISQFEGVLQKVIQPILEEFLQEFMDSLKEFMDTFVDALDTLRETILESAEGYKEALEDATKEVRSVIGEEEKSGEEEITETPEVEVPETEERPEETGEGGLLGGLSPLGTPSSEQPSEQAQEEVSPEGEEEVTTGKTAEKLAKAVLTSDLTKEWEEWFNAPTTEEPEEVGIVVDLEKGEIIGEMDVETGVRFVNPETGEVSKKLMKGKRPSEKKENAQQR